MDNPLVYSLNKLQIAGEQCVLVAYVTCEHLSQFLEKWPLKWAHSFKLDMLIVSSVKCILKRGDGVEV